MKNNENFVKCWELIDCNKKECPAYHSNDLRCWLQCGTNCHNEIQGSWLEKMEECIKCEVFQKNFRETDSKDTFNLITAQFKDYKIKVTDRVNELEASKKKLSEFKLASIYFLRELDKKGRDVNELVKALEEARSNLENKVEEKTREIIEMQTQLIQSAKMATVGQFSAGIAHEINNPLSGILNCIRSLLGDPEIKGQKRGFLELALKGLLRIENTISQILSFSGRQKFNPALSELNHLVKEALAFARHRIEEKNINLNLNLSNSLPPVTVDPHQIQQVFMNIIGNALDALSPGGNLTINSALSGKNIRLDFTDNGKGIKQEYLDKVFDPFFTTKEAGKGVGLGLSICYTIIQQHGGKIDIKSNENKGTTAMITLPLQLKTGKDVK